MNLLGISAIGTLGKRDLVRLLVEQVEIGLDYNSDDDDDYDDKGCLNSIDFYVEGLTFL